MKRLGQKPSKHAREVDSEAGHHFDRDEQLMQHSGDEPAVEGASENQPLRHDEDDLAGWGAGLQYFSSTAPPARPQTDSNPDPDTEQPLRALSQQETKIERKRPKKDKRERERRARQDAEAEPGPEATAEMSPEKRKKGTRELPGSDGERARHKKHKKRGAETREGNRGHDGLPEVLPEHSPEQVPAQTSMRTPSREVSPVRLWSLGRSESPRRGKSPPLSESSARRETSVHMDASLANESTPRGAFAHDDSGSRTPSHAPVASLTDLVARKVPASKSPSKRKHSGDHLSRKRAHKEPELSATKNATRFAELVSPIATPRAGLRNERASSSRENRRAFSELPVQAAVPQPERRKDTRPRKPKYKSGNLNLEELGALDRAVARLGQDRALYGNDLARMIEDDPEEARDFWTPIFAACPTKDPKRLVKETRRRFPVKGVEGRLTQAEEDQLRAAFCDFLDAHGVHEQAANAMVQDRLTKATPVEGALHQQLWQQLREALPDRSLKKVREVARKRFANSMLKGSWTPEQDQELRDLVAQHGHNWSWIGGVIDRHPSDARDRYRNYLVCPDANTRRWTDAEEIQLVSLILEAFKQIDQVRRLTPKRPRNPYEDAIVWQDISDKMGRTRTRLQCSTKWKGMNLPLTGSDTLRSQQPGARISWALEKVRLRMRAITNADKLVLVSKIRQSAVGVASKIRWKKFDYDGNEWDHNALRMTWRRLEATVPVAKRGTVRACADYLLEKYERDGEFGEPGDGDVDDEDEETFLGSATKKQARAKRTVASKDTVSNTDTDEEQGDREEEDFPATGPYPNKAGPQTRVGGGEEDVRSHEDVALRTKSSRVQDWDDGGHERQLLQESQESLESRRQTPKSKASSKFRYSDRPPTQASQRPTSPASSLDLDSLRRKPTSLPLMPTSDVGSPATLTPARTEMPTKVRQFQAGLDIKSAEGPVRAVVEEDLLSTMSDMESLPARLPEKQPSPPEGPPARRLTRTALSTRGTT